MIYRWGKILFLCSIVSSGCVTQTEKIAHHRYYQSAEQESFMDEVRREFGWQQSPPWIQEEPFYKQAARGVKETLTGWFSSDAPPVNPLRGGMQSIREFQQAQKDAIQRLQQQQATDTLPQREEDRGTVKAPRPLPENVTPQE